MYFNLRKWYRATSRPSRVTWPSGLHGAKVVVDDAGRFTVKEGFLISEDWISKRPPKPISIMDSKYLQWIGFK